MTVNYVAPFCISPFGLLSGVKAHLNLLALIISFSGKPKIRYDIVFSLGAFYINKNRLCYPYFLLTSKADFGVKAPPQTCQQSIFVILMAPQINPWVNHFGPLNMNNCPGLPVYIWATIIVPRQALQITSEWVPLPFPHWFIYGRFLGQIGPIGAGRNVNITF